MKKRKMRVLWAIERTASLVCDDATGLVIGICFPTKKMALYANAWAHGKVVKFIEADRKGEK